jgi:hypothetical protein
MLRPAGMYKRYGLQSDKNRTFLAICKTFNQLQAALAGPTRFSKAGSCARTWESVTHAKARNTRRKGSHARPWEPD